MYLEMINPNDPNPADPELLMFSYQEGRLCQSTMDEDYDTAMSPRDALDYVVRSVDQMLQAGWVIVG